MNDMITATAARLETKLGTYQVRNRVRGSYYDGSHKPDNIGFTVPPPMRGQAPRLGWAGVVVDALEERIQFQGWNDPADLGLADVYEANHLDVEASLGHLDALIYGTGFVTVGSGTPGEPDPLVTVTSTMGTTGEWDARTRRLANAFTIAAHVDNEPDQATLYLPNGTYQLIKQGGQWIETRHQGHKLGRVPVVMLPNRTSASMLVGRSEINAPVRDLVDEASRVLLSMAVNREFFSAPQRLVLGVSPDDLEPWEALTTAFLTIEADEQGKLPQVTQFNPVPAGTHIDQLRALAAQLAALTGMPEAYFGAAATTANPASADAIRAAEVRLIKKAERRCAMFGAAWRNVAELVCLTMNEGQLPAGFTQVSCKWGDPGTPTRAAIADETSKLVAAGVLPATSRVTLERLGLSPAQVTEVERDRLTSPTLANALVDVVNRQTNADG